MSGKFSPMPSAKDRRLETLLERVGQLPTLPPVALRILALVEDSKSAVQDLSAVIAKDPALTARVLRLVNSSYYGLPYRVSTVSHAVSLLGFDTVRSLALGLSIFGLFEGKGRGRVLDRNGLWTHSLVSGVAARLLALRVRYAVPEEAFVAGLLHDMGRFILDEYFPSELERIIQLEEQEGLALWEAERRILGFDHAQLGSLLAQRWGLPHGLAQAILGHHQPLLVSSSQESLDPTLTAIVALADRLSVEFGGGDEERDFPAALLGLLGIEMRELDELEDQLRTEADRARVFLGAAGGEPAKTKPARRAHPVEPEPTLLQRLSSLMEVVQQISVLSEDENLLPTVALSAKELSGCDAVLFLLFRGGQWRIAGVVGLDHQAREGMERDLAGPAGRWFLEAGEVIVADDLKEAEVPAIRGTLLRSGFRAVIALPVGPPGRHRGVLLFLSGRPHHWGGEEVGFLMAFTQHVGIAIENAELYSRALHQLGSLEETQARLLQTERLIAFGQLASAFAHEISNPLSAILGYAQSLQARGRGEDLPALAVIEEEGLRCVKLLKDLLDFAQPEDSRMGVVNLIELLEGSLSLLQPRLGKSRIAIDCRWESEFSSLQGDYYQLQQAFLHVFLNAVEAMEDGGQLTVGARLVAAERLWAEVWVKDTGGGIPEDEIPRIDDPLYTTKRGRHIGLGLAICRRIVEAHGGKLSVESRIGEGSVFTIRLPAG